MENKSGWFCRTVPKYGSTQEVQLLFRKFLQTTGNEIAKLHADNKVDVILYAVEKSLDAYKFGLLHNKQLFIRQLKTNNMGSRTIDEGAIDEKSGMNFSEYVAVLSGNTDLLDKPDILEGIDDLRRFVNGEGVHPAHI